MPRRATQQPSVATLLVFARWAMAHPKLAKDVEVIRATFRITRKLAYRWRRAWSQSERQQLPCAVRTHECDLAEINRAVLDQAREQVRRVDSLGMKGGGAPRRAAVAARVNSNNA